MFKRVISGLLSASMLCAAPMVFAESDDISAEIDRIVSTEGFTGDNVIYTAMKEMNRGTALFSADSSNESVDEISADFDVTLGFDMSSAMYSFDYNGEMAWLDTLKALSEQVPDGTRFAVERMKQQILQRI